MLEHLSGEDAEQWLAELDLPLPGQPESWDGEDEIEQLKHL